MSLNNIQNLDIVKSEGQDKSHLMKRRYLPRIVGTTRHELTESSLDLFQENTLPESRQMSTDRSVPNSITTLSTSSSILELSSHSVLKKDVTIENKENLLPPEITNPIQKSALTHLLSLSSDFQNGITQPSSINNHRVDAFLVNGIFGGQAEAVQP